MEHPVLNFRLVLVRFGRSNCCDEFYSPWLATETVVAYRVYRAILVWYAKVT